VSGRPLGGVLLLGALLWGGNWPAMKLALIVAGLAILIGALTGRPPESSPGHATVSTTGRRRR
jgi:hypothetical protein